MKRVYLLILSALLLWSCNKDVMLPPEEPVGKYETAEAALDAVHALYGTGAPAFYGECTIDQLPVAALGGYLSGLFANEAGTENTVSDHCRRLTLESGCFDAIWNEAYQAIAIADEVINNIPLTPGLTSEKKNQYRAEACFFRAFNYFYLARAFGKAPSAVNGDAESIPLAEVYKLIISDLERALPNLPDAAFAENDFRITRSAARILLADVYLFMSGWPLQQDYYAWAAKVAKQVIDGGKHRLATHGKTSETSAYNTIRTKSDNPESIYAYKAGALTALCLSEEAANWGGVVKIDTRNAYMPTRAFMNMYDPEKDVRAQEQQFFHSFVKYEKGTRTVIQTFAPTPYWWFDREALFETGTTRKDVVIYRYAEALLIAAEAIAMSEGVTPEAAGYLADVRVRACPTLERETIRGELAALDRERFVEEVWAERLREFPLEMKIWPDIQRTRKYPVVASDEAGKIAFTDVIGATNPLNIPFEQRHLLLPAP
ncbi:MAG: RagB/SusD family nutrient uptake outer membrane protein [Odoribacteraceae bacterium]|jgi:hypothetical protein|nr:RagB/SusD family nutrient uptake outer membrane protein [Odoribacteraceae bacterium]